VSSLPGGLAPVFLSAFLLPAGQSGAQSPAQSPANEAPAATFRAETNLALVRFQVVAKKNDFVADLRANEVELREDGVPQEIALFEGGRLYPQISDIEIHLMFDCSGSVQQAGVLNPRAFSANLLDEFHNVRIAIWGFSGKSLVYFTAPTRDPARLNGAMEAVRGMKPGATSLPLRPDHIAAAHALAPIHQDPLDRALIAQATVEGFTLVTADEAMGSYGGGRLRILR
jgi:hypothetical protein